MDARGIENLLYQRSNLLGASGITSDMRKSIESDDPRAAAARGSIGAVRQLIAARNVRGAIQPNNRFMKDLALADGPLLLHVHDAGEFSLDAGMHAKNSRVHAQEARKTLG